MDRPKIKIDLEPIDKVIELIGLLGLTVLIGLPIYFFDQLPESIPRHFGANGQPDGYSGKGIIWTLPIIGSIMYAGMFYLNKFPHTFNYPQTVTKENAKQLYTTGTRMIRTLNAIISCVFAYITYMTIQTALGIESGLGAWFIPIFLFVVFGTIGYFLLKSTNKRSRTIST